MTTVAADFPASDTAPKYPMPSMITPLPRLPKEAKTLDKAKGFGWAGFATAIAGVLFGAMKELGGLPVAAAWLKNLSPLSILALSVVFTVAAGIFFGMQILSAIDMERVAGQTRSESRDERMVSILTEVASTLEVNRVSLRGLVGDVADLKEGLAALRPARRSDVGRSAVPEHIAEDTTPAETATGRHRRITAARGSRA